MSNSNSDSSAQSHDSPNWSMNVNEGVWVGIGCDLQQVDLSAAYHAFSRHWQQADDIIDKSLASHEVSQDDVTAVANHLRQMITLLLVDIKQMDSQICLKCLSSLDSGTNTSHNEATTRRIKDVYQCNHLHDAVQSLSSLSVLCNEKIFDKILEWSLEVGEFSNSLKLEQLTAYEILLKQNTLNLLSCEPLVRPLKRLLSACSSCKPVEVERQLVSLLVQLCNIVLNQQEFLPLFFEPTNECKNERFLIFSLLMPYVHREGVLGEDARDALLLCMSLSSVNSALAHYIADSSNFCPLLAAGMCGLYSTLPRCLPHSIAALDNWHRIASHEIALVPNLSMFLDAFRFCNSVVQIAHPVVMQQLVELFYHGFLVLVLGPALHQANTDELVTATAYVELFLSYATAPQLRRAFFAFIFSPLLPLHTDTTDAHCSQFECDESLKDNEPKGNESDHEVDFVNASQESLKDNTRVSGTPVQSGSRGPSDPPLIATLTTRLHSDNTRVCLVTLQLFIRATDCWCEDAVLAVVFQYLLTGTHLMASHRPHAYPYYDVDSILDLMPAVLRHEEECNMCSDANFRSLSPFPTSTTPLTRKMSSGDTAFGVTNVTSYMAMLQSARARIACVSDACANWSWRYDGVDPTEEDAAILLERASLNVRQPLGLQNVVNNNPNENKRRFGDLIVSNKGSNTSFDNSKFGFASLDNEPLANVSIPPFSAAINSIDSDKEWIVVNSDVSLDNGTEPSSLVVENYSCCSGHSTNVTVEYSGGELSSSNYSFCIELDDFLESLSSWDTEISEKSEKSSEWRAESRCEDVDLQVLMSHIDCAYEQFVPKRPLAVQAEEDFEELQWDDESSIVEVSFSPTLSHVRPTVGPLLEALIERVESMLQSPVSVTQLLFSLLLRLASSPCPVLSSFLLCPTLLYQPAVRSLTQALAAVKQRIDSLLGEEDSYLLADARLWFASIHNNNRDESMFARKSMESASFHPLEKFQQSKSKESTVMRGITSAMTDAVGALFKRGLVLPHSSKNHSLSFFSATQDVVIKDCDDSLSNDRQFLDSYSDMKVHAARCAVLLRQLLFELCAIAHQHSAHSPRMLFQWQFPSSTAHSSSSVTEQFSSSPEIASTCS